MPYYNRYFHRRDLISPHRSNYTFKPPSNSNILETSNGPRHVTNYEYRFPNSLTKGNLITKDNKEVSHLETESKDISKFHYKTNYYSNDNESMKREIKLVSEDNNSAKNMLAKIKCPSGKILFTDIIDYDDKHFHIRFTPMEIGEHTISVKQGNIHVSGSPFKIHVEDIKPKGPQNIRTCGVGIEMGFINIINSFSVVTKDSGGGKLSVNFDGPGKAMIELNESEKDIYKIEYKVSEIGLYLCSIKFNDEHVPGSPFKINIQGPAHDMTDDVKHIHTVLSTTLSQGLVVGRSNSFSFNHNGFNDQKIKAYVMTPSNKMESIEIYQLENGKFNFRIKPHEKGVHNIYVLLNDKNILGSPFEVIVGDVMALGKGLINATVGEKTSFKLDTSNADPGPITVTVDGPSKIDLECFDLADGYEFNFEPTVPGHYLISIKYKNAHIHGSPFKIQIYENNRLHSDTNIRSQNMELVNSVHTDFNSYPENVKCRGDGILKGNIGRNNQFIVDASLGGKGALLLGIKGPSKPCDKITIKHIGDNQFQINYVIEEYGKHIINILWDGKEIPNSPFYIYVQ